MNLLSTTLHPLRTLLPSRAGLPRPPGYAGHLRCRLRVEALESRTLLSTGLEPMCTGVPTLDVQRVEIISQQRNIRLAPRTHLEFVVQVTGTDKATGQAVTLTGTADQLQQQAGIQVTFDFATGKLFRKKHLNLDRHLIANPETFRDHGMVQLNPGASGLGVAVVASVCGTGVESTPVQLVRGSGARGGRSGAGVLSLAGAYTGSYSGTGSALGFSEAVGGGVAFTIAGRNIQVTVPGKGSGAISPSGDGTFAFGGGGVQVQGINGSASFSIEVSLLSSGGAVAAGTWTFTGALADGTPVTGSGSWNAARV